MQVVIVRKLVEVLYMCCYSCYCCQHLLNYPATCTCICMHVYSRFTYTIVFCPIHFCTCGSVLFSVSGYFQNVNTAKSVALSILFVNMMEGEIISGCGLCTLSIHFTT